MWQKERGIVVSSTRHSDNVSIIRVFTETRGMASFVFRLGHTQRSAARNSLQQALTNIEFQTDYIPSASLFHMKDMRNLRPNCNISSSPVKCAISLFLSEFLTHALKGESYNPRLYTFLSKSLDWFDKADEADCADFHLEIMLGVANGLGISPDIDGYRKGYVLDLREGCFTDICPHSDFASVSESAAIAGILDSSLMNKDDARLNGSLRAILLRVLNRYFRLHLPDFPVLESIDILETVFAG